LQREAWVCTREYWQVRERGAFEHGQQGDHGCDDLF